MSLFSLGGLEWQTSMEEGEKSAGFLFFLQRFSYTALVSMFHLSYFGLLFSMNFKAGLSPSCCLKLFQTGKNNNLEQIVLF